MLNVATLWRCSALTLFIAETAIYFKYYVLTFYFFQLEGLL